MVVFRGCSPDYRQSLTILPFVCECKQDLLKEFMLCWDSNEISWPDINNTVELLGG